MDSAGQRFDRIARNFATSEVHRESATIRRLHEFLEPMDLDSLCDVACGAGHLGLSFSDSIKRLVFCDPAPNMLSEVRKLSAARNVLIETHECVAERLPFDDNQFDVVCSRLAPHHFGDIRRAMSEMTRVATRRGHVAIIDLVAPDDTAADTINHKIEMLHDPTHRRSYSKREWEHIFQDAGLNIVMSDAHNRESAAGITVERWCQIASSPPFAADAIRAALRDTSEQIRDHLWIKEEGGDYIIPVRTILIVGTLT